MANTVASKERLEASAGGPEDTGFMDTSHLLPTLKQRAVRGGAATVAGQIIARAVQLVTTMVIARILEPRDFGMIAMITAITGFVLLFKDLGLSMATVQRDRITHEQVSVLFWINVGLGGVIAFVGIALAPAIAWFYGEPELLWLAVVLSIGFVFGGLGAQHTALLKRQMRFATLAAISIASLTAGSAVGIVSGLTGAGVWALVYMNLTMSFVGPAAAWVLCRWRPSLPRRTGGIRGLLAFGGNLTGFNVVNYFGRNLDKVLIGRVWGAGSLGLYSRAYHLLLLPLQQVSQPVGAVAIPTLSRLQSDAERYRRYYLKALKLIAFITMPGVVFMIVMSEETIRFVLSEKWIDAARIFAILGVAAFIQPIMGTTGWLFVSTGRTDRMLRLGLVSALCALAAFFIGLPFGAVGVATAYAACNVIFFVPFYWYSCAKTPVSTLDAFRTLWRPVFASAMAGGVLVALKLLLGGWGADIVRLAGGFGVCAVVYVAASCALAGGLTPISELVDLIRQLKPSKPA
jgi:PST family polysaccharide transporter